MSAFSHPNREKNIVTFTVFHASQLLSSSSERQRAVTKLAMFAKVASAGIVYYWE